VLHREHRLAPPARHGVLGGMTRQRIERGKLPHRRDAQLAADELRQVANDRNRVHGADTKTGDRCIRLDVIARDVEQCRNLHCKPRPDRIELVRHAM
jgi:hypothetical protein